MNQFEEIKLGYKILKPVVTQEECDIYSNAVTTIVKHNESLLDGEPLWEIEDTDEYYEIVEGEVPLTKRENLINQKLKMASYACEQNIYNGIDVELSTGVAHFSLQPNDQINIDSIFMAVILGASEYPYHADGKPCTMFSAEDIIQLYINYKNYVTYQTTYCNMLKRWINREEDLNILLSIEYGLELPNDLKTEMQEIIDLATQQAQNIALNLSVS